MKTLHLVLFLPVALLLPGEALADTVPQSSISQDWSNASLITTDDNWNGVPGIVGRRGDDLTTGIGVDPRTVLADQTTIDVIANQAHPDTLIQGGVAEFDGLANPVVALQGSVTADAPFLLLTLNTTNLVNITVSYNLRDVDGSADNAVTPVALQYRAAASGNFTNLAAGFVADATTGPNQATLVTPVSVLLPSAANNKPVVQVRIITTNATGSDEWIGIDDIQIAGLPPCFTDIGAGLPGVEDGAVAWGDYDNDGDLDILLTGYTGNAILGGLSRVYRNSGGPNPTFSDILTGLPGVEASAAAWADFNNDGYLDILLTGAANGQATSRVYINSGGPNPLFTDLLAGLPGVFDGAVSVADHDNDGDLDIAIAGSLGPSGYIARVYRNNGGAHPTFTDIGAGLPGVRACVLVWGDYENDGDLDLLLSGASNEGYIARLYLSSGGANPTFYYALNTGGGANGSLSQGDYDNDGDMDIVYAGGLGPAPASRVLNNQLDIFGEAYFDDLNVGLTGVMKGTAAWGDYDNDGYLDVLLAGYNGLAASAKVFRSSGGETPTFTDIGSGLPGVGNNTTRAAAAWGDYDNDGDLDVLLTGMTSQGTFTGLFRNSCGSSGTPPPAPTNLSVSLTGTQATFSWNGSAAASPQTPSLGLTYNLRIGTAPGLADVLPSMASAGSGLRRVPGLGNTNLNTTWSIELPDAGPYYWSVQAVNGAFAGSSFASEQVIGMSGVEEGDAPPASGLWSGGPNPFSRATTIHGSLAGAGPVSLEVHDVVGRLVRTLVNGPLEAGPFSISWDGRTDAGDPAPSGVYFVRMNTVSFTQSYRLSVVR